MNNVMKVQYSIAFIYVGDKIIRKHIKATKDKTYIKMGL